MLPSTTCGRWLDCLVYPRVSFEGKYRFLTRLIERKTIQRSENGLGPDGTIALSIHVGRLTTLHMFDIRCLRKKEGGAIVRVVLNDTRLRKLAVCCMIELSAVIQPSLHKFVNFCLQQLNLQCCCNVILEFFGSLFSRNSVYAVETGSAPKGSRHSLPTSGSSPLCRTLTSGTDARKKAELLGGVWSRDGWVGGWGQVSNG
jgi:hypothetical protein